jgi:membrane protease YdiL (CAAX protease family)
MERWGMFSAYFLIVNPVIEELYWRGVVQEQSRNYGVSRDAIVALPFSLWHIVPIWIVCGPVAAILGGGAVYCVGVLLTVMYRQTRALGRCIAWHAMMADLAVVSLMFACR